MQITAEVKLNPGPFKNWGLVSLFLLLLMKESGVLAHMNQSAVTCSLHHRLQSYLSFFCVLFFFILSKAVWSQQHWGSCWDSGGRWMRIKDGGDEEGLLDGSLVIGSGADLMFLRGFLPPAPPLARVWLLVPGPDRSSSPVGRAASFWRLRLHPQWWHPAPFSPCQVGLRRDPKLRMTHQHFRSRLSLPIRLSFYIIMELMFGPADSYQRSFRPYANFMTARPSSASRIVEMMWRSDMHLY